MILTVFIGGFVVLLLIGVPVSFGLMATAFFTGFVMWGFDLPVTVFAQRTVGGINNFTILAIPLFLLAGKLMNAGTITDRIFNFCKSLVGHLPGGLAYVNVMASVIFAGMSGSAVADIAGLGVIEIKAMTDNGYDMEFSVAVTAASSLVNPVIPPSLAMVMFGVLSGASITAMFLGGIVPGLLMAASISVLVFVYSVKRKYPRGQKPSLPDIIHNSLRAFLPLMCPLIIIGGIWTGVFTPTESAGIAVFYSFILIMFVFRALKWKELWVVLREALVDCTSIVFIIGCISAYGYVLTRTRVPYLLVEWVTGITTDPLLITFLLHIFFLVCGMFMSTMEAIILFTPVITPLLQHTGIDLVAFGVVCVINLMIGQLTPPFGMVMFVVAKISDLQLNRVFACCMPFIIPVLIIMIMCSIFPGIVTFIPYTFL